MKTFFLFLLIFLTVSCQIVETLHLNSDGSGTIEVVSLRDENSYLQIAGENYYKEEVYKDTVSVFLDYIKKNHETFSRIAVADQNLFLRYSDVKLHKKQNSFEKEFRTVYSQKFKKTLDIADLYKTEEYIDDIKNNYALSAEEHYYKVSYTFDGDTFNRTVVITDPIELKKQFDKIEAIKVNYKSFKLVQTYKLQYHFPRKIRSVSNSQAHINEDGKSLSIDFLLTDCLQVPSITNLEVVLE
jgi:hypothetical protein